MTTEQFAQSINRSRMAKSIRNNAANRAAIEGIRLVAIDASAGMTAGERAAFMKKCGFSY
jgi:hypothetical protein